MRHLRVSFVVSLLLFSHCASQGDGDAHAERPTLCGPLPVAADTVEPIELLFGASNVNAALGDGGLTAGFSSCGELTVLKWPGPSYYDQLDYLSSNAAEARLLPRHGALAAQGAFAGISYVLADGVWRHTWLRDPQWQHRQAYGSEDSAVLVHDVTLASLGLRVRARHFVVPAEDVLVDDYSVERSSDSPVVAARLVYYANHAPTLQRLALFPVADWALDFQNDFVALFDETRRAFLHFVTARDGNRDFTEFNALLHAPPADPAALRAQVVETIDALDSEGVYVAVAPRVSDFDFQVGFDDEPICEHESVAAGRLLAAFDIPPDLEALARRQFVCGETLPEGPLQRCREANGWVYDAESAYDDAADGVLSGSPIAACRANLALSQDLEFAAGKARATVYTAVAATRDSAYALLASARGGDPDEQIDAAESVSAAFLAGAVLPDTEDALVIAFAKRALLSLRTAADRASGGIVASITTQPPYGADWPRDGAFLNRALDLAGYHDIVGRHNRFYARVQRRAPASWSLFYPFAACDPEAPTYPECIPAGTFEMNYYADPDEIVPAGPNSFEIDEAAIGVWTMWDHAAFVDDAGERADYLRDVCPAIGRGARNLAACRDVGSGLPCPANEDDNFELTQQLLGAQTVYRALRSAVAAAPECGFDGREVDQWAERAEELRAAIFANFLVAEAPAHLAGPRRAWALWPMAVLEPDDPLAASHAQSLYEEIEPVLERGATRAGYNSQALLARAHFFRAVGDEAALAESREQVRFFVRELTTPDTLHMAEFYVRVPADLNGDGVAPDYLQSNGVPHVWEQSLLYMAALDAFGSR